ncbi:MAG: SBBP repeat-containing protein [Terriglobia bacterium]
MKHRRVLWQSCVLILCLWAGYILHRGQVSQQPRQADATAAPTAKPTVSYAKLPLSFEANQGQTDNRVKFISHGRGYGLFLTGDEAVLTLRSALSVVRGPLSPRGGIHDLLPRTPNFGFTTPEQRSRVTDNGPRTPDSVVRLQLVGANPNAAVAGEAELPGKANYFLGNDPKQWRTNVPAYGRVKYQGVYPGVDLIYYGNQGGQLEYDFVVAPGADPSSILLAIEGAGRVGSKQKAVSSGQSRIDSNGDLVVHMIGDDEVRFHKPVVYQEQESEVRSQKSEGANAARRSGNRQSSIDNRQLREGRFILDARNRVRFALGPYDRTHPLVIDPVLFYSTNLGGSSVGTGYGIAVDSSGSAYVTGETDSTDFPTSTNALQANLQGMFNCFVAKLNAEGSALAYSTYLGGSNIDACLSIAVDSSGNAYVTGDTGSEDFPTVNPFQAINKAAAAISGESTAFVAKLNSTGSALIYSTYLGGSTQDSGSGIAVDSSGSAYVTGNTFSADFPTAHPFQATCSTCAFPQGVGGAFVTKFNSAGTALVYSTYLSGSFGAVSYGIAVDSSGNAYVTGETRSTDFPTVNPVQAANHAPGGTAFVSKFNPAGSALLYSTYLGGSLTDNGAGIAVDSSGNAYVTGSTCSTDFPTVNPLQTSLSNACYAFVTKLNAAGSALVYSTYLGGITGATPNTGIWTGATSIAADPSGNAYVTGETDATDFPTVNPIQSTCPALSAGCGNAFVSELNPAGSALVYSTYLGGSSLSYGHGVAVDSSGNAYVTGENDATDFPGAPPLQPNPEGLIEAFVAKTAGSPASGPGVTLSTHLLPFLNEPVGTGSSIESVILRSVGADPLTHMNISISGDFALAPIGSSCPYSGGTVASGTDCTIAVTFTPTETGARTGSIILVDNAGDSPQSVSLTGTGVASAPQAVVSPATMTFSPRWAGTSSAPQPVTLSNTGNAPLTITSIAMPPMFSQTNNCGNSVAASGSCTINVTFGPVYIGPASGTLFITDNSNGVPNSTQSVSLNGAFQDFGMTFVSASPSSLDLSPGQSGNYTWAVTALGGFNHSVDFSCSLVATQGDTTIPSAATCTVSPTVITPTTTPTNVTVTVTIPASSESAPRTLPPSQPLLATPKVLLILAALSATAAWIVRGWKQTGASGRRTSLVLLAAGLLLALGLAGCGAGGGSGFDPPVIHPTGTYLTVALTGTATSGSTTLTNMTNIQVYVPN